MKPLPVITAIALAAAMQACGGDNSAVPRRTAFPRIADIGTAMTAVDSLPVRFEVNAATVVTRPRPMWLDVAYPAYGATMHVSFTPVDASTAAQVRDNRLERMMLNAGEHVSLQSESMNPDGFHVLVLESEGAVTPLQFLASDDRTVVSGAVYFADPAAVTATDSIKPIVRAILGDIRASMSTLARHD